MMNTTNSNIQPSLLLSELFRNHAPSPPTNPWHWVEKDDAWQGELELPGFTKEEVAVSIDKERALSVEAQQRELGEGEERTFNRKKVSYRLRLPREANAEKLVAALEHGILRVTLPKSIPDSKIERRVNLN